MGKKILLADDSITIQKVIELTFSDEDFEVVTVGNGRLAIEKVADVRPDVVLCDIIMPEKDGYEVCDFIKKNPALSHIPVLLLTGAFEPFDQERAARVGCDGFLAKPFEPQTLIAKVKDLLSKSASRPAASAGSRPTPSPPPPAAVAPPTPELFPEPDEHEGFPTMVSKPAARSGPPGLDDRFYAGGPVTPPPELTPVSAEEAESLGGGRREGESGTAAYQPGRAPWSQPTIEVPLETRAQAGVSSQAEPEPLFEEVFDAEPAPPPPPAAAAAPPASSAAFGGEESEEVLEEADEEAEPWRPAAPAPPPWAAPPAPAPATWTPAPVPAAAAPWTPSPAPASFADVSPAAPEPAAPPSQAAEVAVPADMVAQIAQRVVAQISEKVVREVAWEVIPDLAEALIKKEIERLKAELQQT